ncbi:lymphocyte antigen 96-like [Labeo rohita]|uniref:lymphocyte antigen 96-like n=1 Tax=Labeo rohita TaxID=84645 RepID=UPI0021E230BA|nr:lymphocyte antigen 96-like [Labeo rohita]
MLQHLSVFLCYVLALPSMSSEEKHWVCSSESVSIWYSYNGPLYYMSVAISPCSLGMTVYNITTTVIPMFTITRIGFHALIYYEDQLWLDHMQQDIPCEDLKLCDIIKGETLHETVPVYLRKYYGPKGEYRIYVDVNIVDDAENILTLRFNVTMQIKSTSSQNSFFLTAGSCRTSPILN